MIQLYHRSTQTFDTEIVAGEAWIRWLYETSSGKFLLEALVKRRFYSLLTGVFCDTRFSRRLIPGFIANYHIPMEESLEAADTFPSFNAFFTRRLNPAARPFAADDAVLCSPGDGRLQVFPQINTERVWQIKGSAYRLQDLLQDAELTRKFTGGSCALLRLAPVDYHRFHFIADGTAESSRRIRGSYYSVNPTALRQIYGVFAKNTRMLTVEHTETLGDILYVEIGATSVGSIVQLQDEPHTVCRGEEKGFFKFGGSTILLFFEPGTVSFDEDLLAMTARGIESVVHAGEKIGQKQPEK